MAAGAISVSRPSAASRIIAVTGVDGSGKTTLTDWLRKELQTRGYAPGFVWSRFNNYVSLPFLAVTRLSGHNVYRVHSGVRMGFHEFERLPMPLRYLFMGLQAVDVNIATLFKIRLPARHAPVTICERGPWDTLVDVAADIVNEQMVELNISRVFCNQLANQADIVLVERRADLIEASRPELKFDGKLRLRQQMYRRLADIGGWKILDNNGALNETMRDFSEWLNSLGY